MYQGINKPDSYISTSSNPEQYFYWSNRKRGKLLTIDFPIDMNDELNVIIPHGLSAELR